MSSIPLWTTGLFVTIVLLVALLTRAQLGSTLNSLSTSWDGYVALGTVYPLAALLLLRSGRAAAISRHVLAVVGAVAIVAYIALTHRWTVLPFAALAFALSWSWRRDSAEDRATALITAAATVTAWFVAVSLGFVAPLGEWLSGHTGLTNPVQAVGVFAIATALAAMAVFERFPVRVPLVWRRASFALVGLAIVIAALRRDANVTEALHLSFYLGPIELVRQGGWLLWEVPSQYGFGIVLANAAIPAPSAYAALTTLNAVLLAVSAAILFGLLRAGTGGIARTAFAALTSSAAVFFMAGTYWQVVGAEHYPSVGAMRFIWCYVIAAIVAGAYSGRLDDRRALLVGSLAYAVGFFWAAESAFYATCMWIPAAAAIGWRSGAVRGALRAGALSVGAVLGAALLVDLVYLVRLHALPEWLAFIEYAITYHNGEGSEPMATLGSVWILAAAFIVTTSVALAMIVRRRFGALPALLAASGLQWSTMSYFVGRSHENNVCNLMAPQLAALALALYALRREQIGDATAIAARATTAAIAAMTIAFAFSPSRVLDVYLQLVLHPELPGSMAQYPRVPPDLAADLTKLGVRPGDPVLFADRYIPLVWDERPTRLPLLWAPAVPTSEFGVLPLSRERVYLRRFVQRRPRAGYLVEEPTRPPLAAPPPLRSMLRKLYVEKQLPSSAPYRIYYYTPR